MVIDDLKTCMIRYQPDQIVEITILKVNEHTLHELASVLATGHHRWLIDWKVRDYEPLTPLHLPAHLQQAAASMPDFRLACLTESAPVFEDLRQSIANLLRRESLRAKWYNTSLPGNHRAAAREWLLEDPTMGNNRTFSYQYFG